MKVRCMGVLNGNLVCFPCGTAELSTLRPLGHSCTELIYFDFLVSGLSTRTSFFPRQRLVVGFTVGPSFLFHLCLE